jgi:hypothetical protein
MSAPGLVPRRSILRQPTARSMRLGPDLWTRKSRQKSRRSSSSPHIHALCLPCRPASQTVTFRSSLSPGKLSKCAEKVDDVRKIPTKNSKFQLLSKRKQAAVRDLSVTRPPWRHRPRMRIGCIRRDSCLPLTNPISRIACQLSSAIGALPRQESQLRQSQLEPRRS